MSRTLAIVSSRDGESVKLPGKGGFDAFNQLALDIDEGSLQATWSRAVELARQADAEWLVLPGPGEVLARDALELTEPALGAYDAIFGAARVTGGSEPVSRPTRLAFDQGHSLPHALLNWWMPTTHIVRTETAAKVLAGMAGGTEGNWPLDYLFEIWQCARCLKSAQPLLELDADPVPLDVEGREHVLGRLMEQPVFLPIVHGDFVYHLPYTGRNAGIEREQSRGLFFEAMELEELRKVVRPGAHVVDVGANTGNHTVFFAGPMKAASVIPFEPLPAAAQALRSAVERNGLANVDLSFIGVGVSDVDGRAKLVFSGRGGLGATSLAPDPSGEISVASLDSMVSGHVDLLKIDVEGMEMSVLAGSRQLIQRCRPLIFIEVANRNTPFLSRWLKDAGYRVMRIFTDKGHANYLLAPGSTG